jgi:hypothetical protein
MSRNIFCHIKKKKPGKASGQFPFKRRRFPNKIPRNSMINADNTTFRLLPFCYYNTQKQGGKSATKIENGG